MSKRSARDAKLSESDGEEGENLDRESSRDPGDYTEVDTAVFKPPESKASKITSFHDQDNKVDLIPIPFDDEELEKYSRYKMNHSKRGIALIFNNENFRNKDLKKRVGAAEDGRELQETLKSLGFEVRLRNDKKLDDMWNEIDQVAKEDHKDCDCLLVAFMTHGNKNDYLYATDYSFKVDDVVERFTSDRVSSLTGKPKIFLFQACRGTKEEDGVTALASATSWVTSDSDPSRYFKLPTKADLLFLYSSMEGYYSWRSPTKGSWFIQDLCKELKQGARTKDILSIVTDTLKRVALTRFSKTDEVHSSGRQQMPVFMSTLTRYLYFYES